MSERLHPDDIQAIATEVSNSLVATPHFCRFSEIKPEDLKEAFLFASSFKKLSEKIGRTVLIIVVSTLTVGIMGLMAIGFWGKIKP